MSVLRRCSIDSISHWAELTFRLMYSRVSALVLSSLQQIAIVGADVERRQLRVFEPHLVLAGLVPLDEHVRRHARHGRLAEVGARLRLELPQLLPDFLDRVDREAGLLRDLRQAIVFEIFEVIGDQRPQLVVVRHARQELQQAGTL